MYNNALHDLRVVDLATVDGVPRAKRTLTYSVLNRTKSKAISNLGVMSVPVCIHCVMSTSTQTYMRRCKKVTGYISSVSIYCVIDIDRPQSHREGAACNEG